MGTHDQRKGTPVITPHVLLVEGDQGTAVALMFASIDTARDWEDKHPAVSVIACAPLVSQARAILSYGVRV